MKIRPLPHRSLPRCVIAFCLLLSVSCIANAQVASAAQAMRHTLATYRQHNPPLSPSEQHFWRAIEDLYFLSPTTFVWLGHNQTLTQVANALKNLQQAENSGLRADDYNALQLTRHWHDLLCTKQANWGNYARFDLALSIAQLHYLSDLRYGRIRPQNAQFDLEPDPSMDKLVKLLLSGIATNQVAQLPAQAEPAYKPYQDLKKQLPRYRTLAQNTFPHLLFSQAVDENTSDPQISVLKQILQKLGFLPMDTPLDAVYSGAVIDAVKRFQHQHGLTADGVIGKKTLAALNVTPEQRLRQIEYALERWRWLPPLNTEMPLILVNIPAYHLWIFQQGNLRQPPDLDMKVIVGMAEENQTPIFMGQLQYLEFGPYWNIPLRIAVKEILPKLKNDPDYLSKHNMELVSDFHTNTQVIPMSETFATDLIHGKIHIRQRPGPSNALGQIKFIFPNSHAVYLHDTPAKRLFNKPRRDLSHGCIRVEKPEQLADYILRRANNWHSTEVDKVFQQRKNWRVRLKQRFQVLLFYNTAQVVGEDMYFFDDVYRLDKVLSHRLQQDALPLQQKLNAKLNALLSPRADIAGIEMHKPGRIVADAATP
ncbi:L,D-transpeptidase family protein [methane-oxidizing endosymbiont of Gigantopelta aegis]|uniref:L,D-transpeptidase family protein n=1 Tax=methane-oxidizing endosymbiont of Gigantopelta aegis TaxID=2794938 RepID=UPI0018DD580A|nr:L,D-transpeptidase family protein [methane-oxidizing endosymbiont of Gigantopelta aegis]